MRAKGAAGARVVRGVLGSARIPGLTGTAAALVSVGGLALAVATAGSGEAQFGFAAPLVDSLAALGRALLARAPTVAVWAPVLGLLGTGLWLAARPWRTAGRAEIAQLGGALGIAATAQVAMLSGWLVSGVALYAVAVTVQLSWRPRSPAPEARLSLWPGVEGLGIVSLFALVTVLLLYRADVYPHLLFDEEAYMVAARLWLGQIADTAIGGPLAPNLYRLERFEAQPIPFGLHLLAVWLEPSGLHAIRLASAAAIVGALAIGVVALRRRLGAVTALGAGVVLASSPLLLTYGRTGLYVAVTILHASLCFVATLRFVEHWDLRRAVPLGLLLAASFYCYQLSWFVPVLAGLVLATSSRFYTGAGARSVAVVALSAAMGLLPALLLPDEGFAQLFRHSRWLSPTRVAPKIDPYYWVLLPESQSGEEAFGAARRAVPPEYHEHPFTSAEGRRILLLTVPKDDVDAALALFSAEQWQILAQMRIGPRWNLARLFGQLFHETSSRPDAMQLRHSLLIPAALVPLLVLGAAEAFRRRREPVFRVLLVWGLAGLLLPPVLTGMWQRRVALALPTLGGLMILPVAAIAARGWRCGAAARATVVVAVAAFTLAVTAIGCHVFFDRWDDPIAAGTVPPVAQRLELVALLRGIDPPVLMPGSDVGLAHHMNAVQRIDTGRTHRVEVVGRLNPARARAITCRQRGPVTWVTVDAPKQTAALEELRWHFVLRMESREGYRIYRVAGPRAGGCEKLP